MAAVYGDALIGMILLGRYRVEEVLGVGGMGVVVRAAHLELGTEVAIKFLLPHMAASPSVVQRFLREAQATVRLRGSHVAKVIDVGRLEDGAPFMIMEYLSGADLGQVLKAHGAQPAAVACDLMLQICEGMSEAHAIGIVHRDVKPSNFFVTRNPDGSALVKILDFGISKVPVGTEAHLTGTQAMVGTPAYMAPEHMRSASKADHRSDIWSMGVVLYQVLTNALPFEGENFADLCLKVTMEPSAPILTPLPPGLGEVLLRCLEKDPTQRFQSVAHLAYALAPFCSEPVVATATAERCGRILEAPRGPRAPTLSAGDMPSAVPLTPYGQVITRSSHPSSLSVGVGEVGAGAAGGKRSTLLYAGVGALVLLIGVGLGVRAAGKGRVAAASSPSTIVIHDPDGAEARELAELQRAREAAAAEARAKQEAEAAEAAARVRAAAAAAEAAREPELQGGLDPEPVPPVPPEERVASQGGAAETSSAGEGRVAPAADAAKPEPQPVKRPPASKPKPKPKKKVDLFQSRE
ncbi:MAG: serine/threonine-protein kinase [Kofleriaceae bacterium]